MSLPLKRSRTLLTLLLQDPQLPQRVKKASSSELMKWIEEIGLEDSGSLLAFAESHQIAALFDRDLWKPEATGGDELFNPERFGTWLEVLGEMGWEAAADQIAALEEDFVVMALSSMVWVAEEDWLQESAEIDPRLEKVMDARLSFEIDGFFLFSKSESGWDSLIALLVELSTRHPSQLLRILTRCTQVLLGEVEIDRTLYEILSEEEQLWEDVAYEREKRREKEGFVAPEAARTFLSLCTTTDERPDHVTPKAFLLEPSAQVGVEATSELDQLTQVFSQFSQTRSVFLSHPSAQERLQEQLTYLANVLMAGWDWQGHPPRPGRALEIVLEVCELGLLEEPFTSFPRAFRRGWKKWLAR